MSQCLICLDDGTPNDSLIQPCNRCQMQTHSKCITDYISRHLLSHRIYFERLRFYETYGFTLSSGIYALNSYIPVCKIPFSRVYKATNYRRYLGLQGKAMEFSSYNPTKSLAIQIENYTSDEIVLQDDCPQCKNLIIIKSKKKQLLPSFTMPSPISLGVAKFTEVFDFISTLELSWPLFFSVLTSFTCFITSSFPWSYLFRNYNPDINSIIAISYLSIKTILPFHFYLICLGSFTSLYSTAFQGFFMPYVLLARCFSNTFYCFVNNRIYMHLALKVYPDRTMKIIHFFEDSMIEETDKPNRWLILLNFDFKTLFKPMWSIEEEPFYPSYFNLGEGKRLFCSITAPFDSALQILGGWIFGHKLLGGSRLFVNSSYTLLKRLNPAPIDIDSFMEFCGYQIVNALVEICDLVYIYYNVKSITSLFIPCPESHE